MFARIRGLEALPLMAVLLLAATALSAGVAVVRHVQAELLWQKDSRFGIAVGERCDAAVGRHAEAGPASWDEVLASPHDFKPLAMPYKPKSHLGGIQIPTEDGYLLTRCHFDPRSLRPTGYAMLHLARVFGTAAVFLNGTLRVSVDDDGVVDVPLTPADRQAPAELVILAWPRPPLMAAGLASNDPPLATDDRTRLGRLQVLFEQTSRDIPAFRWGLGLGLTMVFAAAWLLGLRYLDVGWMVVATSFFVLQNAAWYKTDDAGELWHRLAFGWTEVGGGLALAAFMIAFMRLPGRARLTAVFVGLLGAYTIGMIVLPISITNHSRYRLDLPYAATGLTWIASGILGLLHMAEAPSSRRRRLRLVAAIGIAGGTGYLAQIYFNGYGLVYVQYLRLALVGLFATWLGADLVVFQQRFFAEQAARREDELASAKDRQLARMTQMVAHDVRKPFTMLRTLLNLLIAEPDGRRLAAMAGRFGHEIDATLSGVEGMLEDLLVIDRKGPLVLKPLDPAPVIAEAIHDVFRLLPDADVGFTYDFSATAPISAHRSMVHRLFVNLVTNAVEAMGGVGRITVSTRDVATATGSPGVQVTVANSGSYIPPERLARLFEAFETSGKAGGTGLGLAIANRIMKGHNGTIGCTSDRSTGTAFHMTFSAGAATEILPPAALPGSSQAIRRDWLGDLGPARPAEHDGPPERPVVAVVDDDLFVREAWETACIDANVVTFPTPEEFWRAAAADGKLLQGATAIVSDFHFGADSVTGTSFLAALRQRTRASLFLATDWPDAAPPAGVSLVPKEPVPWHRLSAYALRTTVEIRQT